MIIHEDSTSENRDNGSFSIISLTECQEALSEKAIWKTNKILTLSGDDVRTRSLVLTLQTLQIFLQDISSNNET